MDELFGYGKAVTLIVLMAATLGVLAVATMLRFVPWQLQMISWSAFKAYQCRMFKPFSIA